VDGNRHRHRWISCNHGWLPKSRSSFHRTGAEHAVPIQQDGSFVSPRSEAAASSPRFSAARQDRQPRPRRRSIACRHISSPMCVRVTVFTTISVGQTRQPVEVLTIRNRSVLERHWRNQQPLCPRHVVRSTPDRRQNPALTDQRSQRSERIQNQRSSPVPTNCLLESVPRRVRSPGFMKTYEAPGYLDHR
jgi:hypothetical protein